MGSGDKVPENLSGTPDGPESEESSSVDFDRVKNPAAVELGRLGGRKGGRARAEKLTPEQRSAIARRAAVARWSVRRTS